MDSEALKIIFLLLKNAAMYYISTKSGAGNEFSQLQNDLNRLVAHLKDEADRKRKNHSDVEMEKQVRELVYRVEDVIDMCLADEAAAKTKGFFRRLPGMLSIKMAATVKDLRAKEVKPALEWLEGSKSKSNDEGSGRGSLKPNQQGNSMSSGNETSDLESSYRALAHDRRACLVYTALFPEDYISASTLTELWIAENFISQNDEEPLEDTAMQLLEELINKKLLVAHEMRLDQVKTCRVDNNIRKFCKQKAIEENLFTVIESHMYAKRRFFRLCFYSDPSNFLFREEKLSKNVRSFLCLAKVKDPIDLAPQNSSTFSKAFIPLRILKCESTKFEELPKNLTRLKLLKHITLWIDNLKDLPKKLSKLSNLQTLIIKTDSKSITVRANIWRMEQLRHLKAKAILVLDDKKWRAGEATNLQTISRLSPTSCTKDLSKKAPYLKSLGIQGELGGDLLGKLGLEKFKDLEKLKLLHTPGAPVSFPSSNSFPVKLNNLTLSNTGLMWSRDMAKVAEINTLKVLKLKDRAFKGAAWMPTNDSYKFPNLKLLLINNTDLRTWGLTTREFPLLECIVIKNCQNLKSVSDSLAKKVIELEEVPDSLAKQVEDSKTDASSSSNI